MINLIAPLDKRLLKLTNGWISLTGGSTILLTTTGAKSGQKRTSTLPGLFNEEKIILLASKGGADHHPAWYHNLTKNTGVEVLRRGKLTRYRAHTAQGEERKKMMHWLLEQWDGFEAYEKRAAPRIVPVVVLSPID